MVDFTYGEERAIGEKNDTTNMRKWLTPEAPRRYYRKMVG